MPELHTGISLFLFHFNTTVVLHLPWNAPQESQICNRFPQYWDFRNSDLLLGASFTFYTVTLPKFSLLRIIISFHLPPSDSKGELENSPYTLRHDKI